MSGDNHGGIIWFLSALIILTLTGVFLSLMVDKRHKAARTGHTRADAFAENAAVLLGLRAELESLEERHRLSVARDGDYALGLESEEKMQTGIREGIASLQAGNAKLQSSIQILRTEFSDYRARSGKTQEGNQLPDKRDAAFSREPVEKPAARESEIAALRAEIALGRSRISGWKAELSVVESNSRYGDKRSVPGSLRTWGEQAAILRNNITRAEAHLVLVIEKLRSLSPSDPALTLPR
jgi:chromosome segregation ATPase